MPVIQAEEAMHPLQVGERLANKDTVSGTPSNTQVATAHSDYEKLRRDLSAAYSQIAELDKRRRAQVDEIDSVEHEIEANCRLSEGKQTTINRLTAEVGRWESAVAVKMEQIAAELQAKEKIQRELAAFPSHIADLEQRYDAQCSHNELQTLPEHTIAFLTTALMQAHSEDRAEAERIATARRDLEHLLRLLSTPIIIAPERYVAAAQSQIPLARGELPQDILVSSFSAVKPTQAKMRLLSPISFLDGVSLAALRAAERQIAALQMECDNMSKKLETLRNKLQVIKSKVEEQERTIAALTAQRDQRERAAATMAENLAAVRRDIEQLLDDLAAFSPHIADLEWRYDAQSKAIRDQFQTKTSLLEHIIAFLTTAFMQARSKDRAKSEQIATARRDLEHLQYVLSEQMISLQERYEAQSQELKSFRDKLHSIPELHQPTYCHTVWKVNGTGSGSWEVHASLIPATKVEGFIGASFSFSSKVSQFLSFWNTILMGT